MWDLGDNPTYKFLRWTCTRASLIIGRTIYPFMTSYKVPSRATALIHSTVPAPLGFGGGKPRRKSVQGECGSQAEAGRPFKDRL